MTVNQELIEALFPEHKEIFDNLSYQDKIEHAKHFFFIGISAFLLEDYDMEAPAFCCLRRYLLVLKKKTNVDAENVNILTDDIKRALSKFNERGTPLFVKLTALGILLSVKLDSREQFDNLIEFLLRQAIIERDLLDGADKFKYPLLLFDLCNSLSDDVKSQRQLWRIITAWPDDFPYYFCLKGAQLLAKYRLKCSNELSNRLALKVAKALSKEEHVPTRLSKCSTVIRKILSNSSIDAKDKEKRMIPYFTIAALCLTADQEIEEKLSTAQKIVQLIRAVNSMLIDFWSAEVN
ncbi:MAG: hypothetical protein KatS3mg087_1161 [Patescibacteria group bacterium]|nr:MAG: hypothetical protein KatS3mg087_1161 [Patescibacteria group bacterium]